MEIVFSTLVAIGRFLILSIVLGSFFTVQTAQVAIITRFGLSCAAPTPA